MSDILPRILEAIPVYPQMLSMREIASQLGCDKLLVCRKLMRMGSKYLLSIEYRAGTEYYMFPSASAKQKSLEMLNER